MPWGHHPAQATHSVEELEGVIREAAGETEKLRDGIIYRVLREFGFLKLGKGGRETSLRLLDLSGCDDASSL